jgi:structural maintenance of chromosome 4
MKETLKVLEQQRDILAKNHNMGAMAEYQKKEQDYLPRIMELDEVTELRNLL